MNLFTAPEFKVGLLVLIVSGLIAAMSLRVSNDPGYLGTSKEAWFHIDNASGLVKNSAVRMAGIDVGVIKDIVLENGKARVEMVLQGDLLLTESARVEIVPNGILGDKYVQIMAGNPQDPVLPSGGQILVVNDRASVDRLIGEVSKITESLSDVAESIRTGIEGDTDQPLGRIISNIERLTSDLAQLSAERRDELGEIVGNLHDITETVNELVNDESDDGLRKSWRDAMRSLRRIEGTLKNTEEITAKINRGEGTLGKLVNDETTVEELNTAIGGINNFLDTSNKISTSIDFHSDYLFDSDQSRSYLSVRVQPGLDRYYEIGVVDDPSGVTESVTIRTTTDSTDTTVREEKRFENKVKFNAVFAKNFYNVTIRGGILENTGGIAADYHLLKRKLRFSLEAFDFEELNLRASARYNLFHGIYVTGGGEDLASNSGRASGFIGAGLFLTNDDLKLLLSSMPF